jgi:hypothetical protein
MLCYVLVRDQEVEGSNPFAPTNRTYVSGRSHESSTYKTRKSKERLAPRQEVVVRI